ncbi:MAG TPA: hypothetical protein VM925_28080 [Labilithrix sp.]|nr:hypothetical protein [Labilithrix sp.]
MISTERSPLLHAGPVLVALVLLAGCKDKDQAVVVDAGIATTTTAVDAGTVDLSQCIGCQLAPQQAWSFQGTFRDDACTEPLAQTAPTACAVVPAIGDTSLTYAEEIGARKAGEVANVKLTEQVAPTAARFRKSGTKCVRADESAVDLTPAGCAGQKVCRDANGALACTGCRTLSNGCPDYEETRMYATINDPSAKGAKTGGGGGGGLARLQQCCTQLAAEAKRLGSSPEAGMLNSAAAQCTTLVKAAGPTGTAPELGAIRTMLAGRNIPAVCAGF